MARTAASASDSPLYRKLPPSPSMVKSPATLRVDVPELVTKPQASGLDVELLMLKLPPTLKVDEPKLLTKPGPVPELKRLMLKLPPTVKVAPESGSPLSIKVPLP